MPTIPWSWFNELQVNGFCHTTKPACDPSGNTITKTELNCYLLFCSSVTRVTMLSRMAHDSRLNYPLLVIFTCKCKLLDHAKLFSSQYDFWIPNILTIKNILSCRRVPKADQNITKDFLVVKSWLLMVVRDCMSSLMNFLIKIERTDNSKLFFYWFFENMRFKLHTLFIWCYHNLNQILGPAGLLLSDRKYVFTRIDHAITHGKARLHRDQLNSLTTKGSGVGTKFIMR